MASNYWLSNWSNKVAAGKLDTLEAKLINLAIYGVLGFSKCK
jgi:hypothetical protein